MDLPSPPDHEDGTAGAERRRALMDPASMLPRAVDGAGAVLVPRPEGAEEIELADAAPTAVGVHLCPKCGVMRRADQSMCDRCGASLHDAAAHAARERSVDEPRPCRQCGYDLRGLSHSRCPECGAGVPRGARRQRIEAASDEYRRLLRRALIIGGTLAILLLVVMPFGGWRLPIIFVVFASAELAIALGAAVLLSMVLIDLDDPLPLTASRIFAAQMITTASMVAMLVLCAPGVVIGVAVYLVAVALLFELDVVDGLYLGAALAVIRIGLVLAAPLLL